MTHIGTATAILDIDGITFLTDPVFSPAGTEFDVIVTVLKVSDSPALKIDDLPPIDAVLLSHEDHPDNLDDLGRRLLDGRHVFTTMDGAKKLAPRPGVRGLTPWQTVTITLGSKEFQVTATPCQHLPGGECTGFVLTTESFGISPDGRPNAIYFSGDTVYVEELAKTIPEKWRVVAAIFNLGNAQGPGPDGPIQITMDGKSAARLFRELGAEVLIPMHYESWSHFAQLSAELKAVFENEGLKDKVCWLVPGKKTTVI